MRSSRARSVHRTGDGNGDGHGASVLTSIGEKLEAPIVVDATGRSGIVARSFRRKEARFRTLALTAHFPAGESTSPDATVIESFEEGWVWSQPLQNGMRDVTVMIDLPAGGASVDRRALHRRALAAAPHVGALVGSAEIEVNVGAAFATSRVTTTVYVCVVIGDHHVERPLATTRTVFGPSTSAMGALGVPYVALMPLTVSDVPIPAATAVTRICATAESTVAV